MALSGLNRRIAQNALSAGGEGGTCAWPRGGLRAEQLVAEWSSDVLPTQPYRPAEIESETEPLMPRGVP